jgi:hypothetical protein
MTSGINRFCVKYNTFFNTQSPQYYFVIKKLYIIFNYFHYVFLNY